MRQLPAGIGSLRNVTLTGASDAASDRSKQSRASVFPPGRRMLQAGLIPVALHQHVEHFAYCVRFCA